MVRTRPTWTRRFLIFSAVLLGTLLGIAAAANADQTNTPTAVTFTKDVAPILQTNVRRAIVPVTSLRWR